MDRSAPPIALEPRPSNAARIALAAVAALALGSILLTRLAPSLAYVLAALVLFVAWRAERELRGVAGLRLALQRDGTWLVRDAAAERTMTLEAHATIGPLVALRLAGGGAKRSLMLLPGMVDDDALRTLRVWLRHGYPSSG